MTDEFTYKFCLYCGKKLEQNNRGRRKKYCSIECKRKWEKTHHKTYNLHCAYCEKEYKAFTNKNRKYCSHDCYIKDRFWRKEDAAEILKNISENKKVEHVPKWLKKLLLSNKEE